MSWSDLDLTLDLAVVTLNYKILSGLFNARREIHTAAVVLFSLYFRLWRLLQAKYSNFTSASFIYSSFQSVETSAS